MKIDLITPEEHARILEIYNNHPILLFQNNGYQYIDKKKLTDDDLKAIKELETLLQKSIYGFHKFNNFKKSIRKDNQKEDLVIRFQYNYNYNIHDKTYRTGFKGVGYIAVDELLNGFYDNPKDYCEQEEKNN